MAVVEPSQSLSIDRFSYSWLINLKPSLESISDSFRAALDSSDESSFIDMDPKLPPSKRFNKLVRKDLDFDLPYSEISTAAIVHADKLFSNGLLVPLTDASKTQSSGGLNASLFSNGQKRKVSLRRCRSLLSRKMFEKYLNFLCPLLEKIRCCRLSKSNVVTADNRMWAVKSNNRTYSALASPRTSVDHWRRSCDSESSIHEAVLHCKRSIGM